VRSKGSAAMRVTELALLVSSLVLTASASHAQWLKEPTKGIPRTADGKPNLTAPAPRTADGKPDLSGIWRFDNNGPYGGNVLVDLKPDEIRPGVDALYKQRMEDLGKDDPATFRCLPTGPRALYAPQGFARIIQTPRAIAMLYEDLTFRQIFMDGRALPKDPNPSFMGYSVGRWDGDTLVVDSIGFNETSWLDFGGHPHSEALRTTERITRKNFGRFDVEVRFDDPKIVTRPFTVPTHAEIVTDTDMIEYVCSENQKDLEHLVGKASDDKKLAVKVAPEILAQYVGTYSSRLPEDPSQVFRFNITRTGETLSMDVGGKDPQAMVALSNETFSVMGTRLDFVKDGDKVTHLIFHIVEGDMKATKD
jgi:hypothetical protein